MAEKVSTTAGSIALHITLLPQRRSLVAARAMAKLSRRVARVDAMAVVKLSLSRALRVDAKVVALKSRNARYLLVGTRRLRSCGGELGRLRTCGEEL